MTLIRLTFFLVITGLISCSKTTKETDSNASIESGDSKTEVIEKFVLDDNKVAFDTIVESLGLQIIINEKTLDTYVINEYTIDNVKHVDKYRDIERQLKILKENEILVDTFLRKETFGADLDKEFLNISNFHGYWINKIQADTIEFFGVISKPETDWSYAFFHYFDTKTKTFVIKEHIDEEI